VEGNTRTLITNSKYSLNTNITYNIIYIIITFEKETPHTEEKQNNNGVIV